VLNVRATVTAFDELVGVAENCQVHWAKWRTPMSLALRLPAQVLRSLERRRNGSDIVMSLTSRRGSACFAMSRSSVTLSGHRTSSRTAAGP